MAEIIQCGDCGAVLSEEDLFCGECGAPNPFLTEAPGSVAAAPAASEEPAAAGPPPAQPSFSPPAPAAAQPSITANQRWRAATIALFVLGILACVVSLIAFFLFGSTPSEATTVAEDWIFSAICCLLPIGGSGAVLLIIGAIIWYTRLRER